MRRKDTPRRKAIFTGFGKCVFFNRVESKNPRPIPVPIPRTIPRGIWRISIAFGASPVATKPLKA